MNNKPRQSILELLQSKGIKVVKKTGGFMMPVSKVLQQRMDPSLKQLNNHHSVQEKTAEVREESTRQDTFRAKGRAFLEELKTKGPNLDKVGKSFIYFKFKFKG